MKLLRAHFDGQVLIPEGQVDLPRNRMFEIEVREIPLAIENESQPAPGSFSDLYKAATSAPHLTAEDARALEESIAQGKLPPCDKGFFDDP